MPSDDPNASIPISPELAEVLDSILRDLGQVVQYDRVHILLLSSALQPIGVPGPVGVHDADMLITVRDRGMLSPDLTERDNIPLDLYPLNRALLDDYQPIVISDTLHDVRWIKEGVASGIRAWIGAPLVVKDKAIGVLGLAFKPNTDDMRLAPSINIIRPLLKEGAKIKAFDPQAMGKAKEFLPDIEYCPDAYAAAAGVDALIICTEWDEFRSLDLAKLKAVMGHPTIFDGRNLFDPKRMADLGFTYTSIGR